jgi:chromosome partition protein MukE
MSDKETTDVYLDPLFPELDVALRQGKHLGTESDPFVYDFLSCNQEALSSIFGRYRVALVRGPEGYFYLRPHSDNDPAPLGRRHLTKLDMLVGLALSSMYLDPEWLQTGRRIPEIRILAYLEQVLGTKQLLQYAGRRRGHDEERDALKLKESCAGSLRTLERLGFIQREGRRDSAAVIPLSPIMRFADPLRSSGPTMEAIERLIREGEIEEIDEGGNGDSVGD